MRQSARCIRAEKANDYARLFVSSALRPSERDTPCGPAYHMLGIDAKVASSERVASSSLDICLTVPASSVTAKRPANCIASRS